MYRYTRQTRELVCVSCQPSGEPPVSRHRRQPRRPVHGRRRSHLLRHRRRARPRRHQPGPDVYEYVDGRPQLITSGTGDAVPERRRFWSPIRRAGPDRCQRQRQRRVLRDLRHPGPPGPQRPLPQVLRRPLRTAASRRRRRRRPAPPPTSATAAASAAASARRHRLRRLAPAATPSAQTKREASTPEQEAQHTAGSVATARTRRHRTGVPASEQSHQDAPCRGPGARRCLAWRSSPAARRPANSPITSTRDPLDHPGGRSPRLPDRIHGQPLDQPNARALATARTPKTSPSTCRPASSATRTPRRSARSPTSPPTTARSTPSRRRRRTSTPWSDRSSSRRLQPRPAARTSPGCSPSRSAS